MLRSKDEKQKKKKNNYNKNNGTMAVEWSQVPQTP